MRLGFARTQDGHGVHFSADGEEALEQQDPPMKAELRFFKRYNLMSVHVAMAAQDQEAAT